MKKEERPEGRSRSTKRWIVNFSLDAGTIGQVHVTMGLSANALTVRMGGDQAEFFGGSQRLASGGHRAALEQADFAVEDLSVREGGIT